MSIIQPMLDLYQEIIEVFERYDKEASVDDILAILNGPARVQGRGFFVRPASLLSIIIDMYRINKNTRFIVIDDLGGLASDCSFRKLEDAQEIADQCDGGVRRFQL